MIFDTGYLTLRTRGAPLRVHWTTPIGAYVLTGADYVPGAWLGFFLLDRIAKQSPKASGEGGKVIPFRKPGSDKPTLH